MRITPLEIRQHTFDKTFRGYDAESVDAFLLSLSQEWERVAEELRHSKQQLEVAEREVARMKEIETSLFKTIKIAETAQQEINEKAKAEADKTLDAAKLEAEQLVNEARKKADMTIIDAESKAQFILKDAQSDLRHFERDFRAMDTYKDHLVLELKRFANETLEKVTSFEERINATKLNEQRAAELALASEAEAHEEETDDIVAVSPVEVNGLTPEITPIVDNTNVLSEQEELGENTPAIELLPLPLVSESLAEKSIASNLSDDYDDEIGELPSVHAILASENLAETPTAESNLHTVIEVEKTEVFKEVENIADHIEAETVVPSKLNKLTTENDGKDLGLPTVSSVMNELTKENLTNGGGFVNSAASFFDDL